MWQLFLLVLSLASVSFGGGQIILAGLDRELVQTGRMDPQSFAVAVALGQSTPGPLAAFTTAVGMELYGPGGGAVATAALLIVSLGVVVLISRIPGRWFNLPQVKAGLTSVAPLVAALALFLGAKTLLNATPGLLGVVIAAAVAAGRLAKLPSYALVLGAIAAGMLLA